MRRHRNPFTNGRYCPSTPHKVRYPKAWLAWKVGAKQISRNGIQLFLYRCQCGGWHLTKRGDGPDVTKIETKVTMSKCQGTESTAEPEECCA